MSQVKVFIIVIVVLFVGVLALAVTKPAGTPNDPGRYDEFAQCIKDSGSTFFGAFWCPHCQSQKKMFGASQKFLPYVECSLPNGNGQTQVCIDAEIETYPTWQFADGDRVVGELELEELAEKTGCELPLEE